MNARVDPQTLIDAARSRSRFEMIFTLDNFASYAALRFDDADEALSELHGFTVRHRLNPEAEAAIYDYQTMRYTAQFYGAAKFGPVDQRHPMVKLYQKAARAGVSVVVAHG
jgi:hypothetical protein